MAEANAMTLKTRLSVLLISTPVLAFVLVGGLLGKEKSTGDQTIQQLRVFEDVVGLVISNYVEDVNVDRVMEGAMRGLADGLDPDSAYLTPKLMRAVETGETLPDGDVGLELTRQYYLRVIAARDGSPAAKAGLFTGDYVRAIDGRPTRDMSVFEGSRLLRGQPGSKVTLTVIRGNAADPHEIPLVREKPSGPVVSGRLVAGDIGYIRISSFRAGVVDELRKQAADLAKAGATSLAIDIRRTAEGPYDNGIAAARLFVKSGTLAMKAGRDKQAAKEPIAAAPGDGTIELPVQVLVANGTAGPAELFAAALDGNKRGELIGEHTLGRAGLQKLVKLPENRALWLTYARYLTPAGEPIQGKGLEPKVEVEEPDVEFGAAAPEKDSILDAAIERAHAKKAA
jgi:carboxyl-terminal processing protease